MNLEEYFDPQTIKGNAQSFIAEKTAQILQQFCEQEQEFAQAVEQSGKTFQQCLDHVIKGIVKRGSTGSLSDLDAYNRAVKFYFPCAEVHQRFELDLIGNAKESASEAKSFDFMSLMDW
ncbi:MAG: hypothetical protein K2J25_03735 [Oscillospiraceae bacterium]|nr:hypothetical protein [Oscillospiraceae bacterium]